jgi:protein-disulfide isomerase
MHEEHKKEEKRDEHNHHYEEHKEKKSDTIELNKETVWKVVSGLLGILLILSIFTGGFGIDLSPNNEPLVEIRDAQAQQDPTKIDVDGRSFKGVKNAKITIVEYSSFSCGYCNRVRGTIDQILNNYPDDVKIVFKHFNRGGTDSMTAQATECAGDQEKFWEMHDAIFDKGSSGDIKAYAKDIGLNTDSFVKCLDSGKYSSRVNEDTSEGRSLGVSGTPSFIINGQLVSGAQPFENFKKVIEAELAK